MNCDIRILAEGGKYGDVQVRRGIMPHAYSHWVLPRLVGMSRAAEILLSGTQMDAQRARDLGVANQVLPADEVLPAALKAARDIAIHTAPLSVAVSKRLLWESLSLSPEDVEAKETALHHHLMAHSDAGEGVLAYLEKRSPRWSGSVAREFPDWPSGKAAKEPQP